QRGGERFQLASHSFRTISSAALRLPTNIQVSTTGARGAFLGTQPTAQKVAVRPWHPGRRYCRAYSVSLSEDAKPRRPDARVGGARTPGALQQRCGTGKPARQYRAEHGGNRRRALVALSQPQ